MTEEQKFDPVKEFIALRDNISKTIGQNIKNVVAVPFPAVDIYETDEAIIVYTQPMIGIDKSSVEVGMEDEVLTLSGETKPHVSVADKAYLHREIQFGRFTRSIRIPLRVKPDAAKASFKDNILTITLPKQKQVTGQIIEITPAE